MYDMSATPEPSPAPVPQVVVYAKEPTKKRKFDPTPEIVLRVASESDDEDRGEPLPEGATGFRGKKAKKEKKPPKMSSTIPELNVGTVRKCLNRE